MQRINSINARPDLNGLGKKGFHDNNDISGQDATYLTPDWCNTVQEVLSNLLEKNGISLNPTQNDQLYQLLTTHTDLLALSEAIEQNFLRKDKLNNTLTSTSNDQALTAAQGKVLKDLIDNLRNDLNFQVSKTQNGYLMNPNGLIFQWGTVNNYSSNPGEISIETAFPIDFPTNCLNIQLTRCVVKHSFNGDGVVNLINFNKSNFSVSLNTWGQDGIADLRGFTWFATGF